MTTITEMLPPHAYLATLYHDWRNNVLTRRVFYTDGRVEAFDGQDWWTVCEFLPEEVRLAQQAILNSGLPEAKDLEAGEIHDTAVLTYAWRLMGREGMIRNYAYPALDHPAFELLETELEKLYAET